MPTKPETALVAEARDLSRLRRSSTDRHVAGVAGGLGRHLDVDPVILRVAFVVLARQRSRTRLHRLGGRGLAQVDQGPGAAQARQAGAHHDDVIFMRLDFVCSHVVLRSRGW